MNSLVFWATLYVMALTIAMYVCDSLHSSKVKVILVANVYCLP